MNAQETPTPLTLYPFRLEEAKQNLGNVVTRDGKPWSFISMMSNSCPCCQVSGNVDRRTIYWSKDGKFYTNKEDALDLFMTTPPEDKPAPLTLSDLHLLTNGHPPHREDGWTRDMLPEGTRPLCKEEKISIGDEFISWNNRDWHKIEDSPVFSVPLCHHRTRRPAPPKAEEEATDFRQIGYIKLWLGVRLREIHTVAQKAREEHSVVSHHCDLRRAIDSICDRSKVDMETLAECGKCYNTAQLQELDDLRTRLTTAEQEITRLTRERDEARCLTEHFRSMLHVEKDIKSTYKSNAETAEATVARLEGELAEAKQGAHKARKQADEFLLELHAKNAALASHTWTPTSERMPTEADADEFGMVNFINEHGSWVTYWNNEKALRDSTHWMTPIPLPPAEQTEEETDRKAAQRAYDEYCEAAPHGRVATFNDFLIGWQAARKGGGK